MFNNMGTTNMGSNNLGTNNMGSSNLGPQHLAVPNNKLVPVVPNSGSPMLHYLTVPNSILSPMTANSRSPRLQDLAVPNGKLAPMSPSMGSQSLQHFAVPNNKQASSLPNSSNLGHVPVSNKRTIQMISGTPNKPASQKSSAPNKPNKRPSHTEPPKARAESFELVRAKMRESLASALAMVSEEQNKNVEKKSQVDAQTTSIPPTEDSPMSTSTSSTLDNASCQVPEKPLELSSSQNQDCAQNVSAALNPSQDIFSSGNKVDTTPIPKCDVQEYQYKYALLDDDVSFSNNFFVKDDLLQGNGLCWASDLDVEIMEDSSNYDAKRAKLENEVGGNKRESTSPCPQTLATSVEAELFKAFGGVNKKYKEKGRSLLFNLKDPSNPELRERVLSGEISPERLCSMTAEELASKELSEWRIAKAEELAQMVVLPDSQVDIRRLVRKTHKGEFQVEFDQDDGPSVEVTAGESSLSEFRPRAKELEAETLRKPDENEKLEITSSEKVMLDDQGSLSAVPSDGTDLLQGLMMDEMKDPEFLPPIVSLDEFMESLDSEPPFENLQKEAGTSEFVGEEKKSIDTDVKVDSSDLTSDNSVTAALEKAAAVDKAPIVDKAAAPDKADKVEPEHTSPGTKLRSSEVLIDSKTPLDGAAANIEHAWEGKLQLNISSIVTVRGSFISGEKASAKEWPSFLDIKGRVKLDAFEKFLHELPMSRSRALMVIHFSWKEDSPESGRGNLREVADSYVADERVGFAEPAPAVELYLCPPHARTVEMLGKNVPKDDVEKLNALDNGLIGIVVWRKVHVTSTISPNSSSHHKHSSKKQNHTKRQQQEKETNRITKPTSSILGPPPTRNSQVPLHDEPIDDVPPGFGPATGRDDDDLPEFEFVVGSNPPVSQFPSSKPSVPPRTSFAPPGQMRELIQMYGQNETVSNKGGNWQQVRSGRVEVNNPWNDDDDIPEWQPPEQNTPLPPVSLPPPPPLPLQLIHGFQQQTLPHVAVPPHQLPHVQLMVQQPTQQNMQFQAPVNMFHSYVGSHQNMASPWQSGGWTQTGSSGLPLNNVQQQGNNMMQPCNSNNSNNNNNSINGQPFDGQFYGTFSNTGNGFGTRPDNVSRRY
ncbi:hypothetical protein MKX01_026206 [Papaver californicum]|nr:hypothetical protein MKX01_026206 [Papaver californicum]